jgi:prepilin-type processing-associated H-X9-DG protein
MGGNNIGFADGHAKWWAADAMIAGAGNWKDANPSLQGIQCQCLPNAWSS